MGKDSTHLWFCSLFSWHFSRILASYSNVKLPPIMPKSCSPFCLKMILVQQQPLVSRQVKGSPPGPAPNTGTSPSQTHMHTFCTVVCHLNVLAGCTFSLNMAKRSETANFRNTFRRVNGLIRLGGIRQS